jgi:Family of unknown function (DUF6200)
MVDEQDTSRTAEHLPPIHRPYIVDLGKASNRQIRALKRGEGKLQDDVEDAIHEVVTEHLKEADKNRPIVPIILIYRKRRRRSSSGGSLPFPLSPLNLLR